MQILTLGSHLKITSNSFQAHATRGKFLSASLYNRQLQKPCVGLRGGFQVTSLLSTPCPAQLPMWPWLSPRVSGRHDPEV